MHNFAAIHAGRKEYKVDENEGGDDEEEMFTTAKTQAEGLAGADGLAAGD